MIKNGFYSYGSKALDGVDGERVDDAAKTVRQAALAAL